MWENIQMMMDTVRQAGYPVDIEWVEEEIRRCQELRGEERS